MITENLCKIFLEPVLLHALQVRSALGFIVCRTVVLRLRISCMLLFCGNVLQITVTGPGTIENVDAAIYEMDIYKYLHRSIQFSIASLKPPTGWLSW